MSSRMSAEHHAVMRVRRVAKVAKAAQQLHTANRHAEDAARIVAAAQSEVTQAIVDVAPLLGFEQIARCRAVFAAVAESAPDPDESARRADEAA